MSCPTVTSTLEIGLPCGTGLVGHQRLAQQAGGGLLRLLRPT